MRLVRSKYQTGYSWNYFPEILPIFTIMVFFIFLTNNGVQGEHIGTLKSTAVQQPATKTTQATHPLYYGFMASQEESILLQMYAAKIIRRMLKTPEMSPQLPENVTLLINQFANTSDEVLSRWPEGKDFFHVTTFYTGYGAEPGFTDFAISRAVQSSLNRLQTVRLTGLLVTNLTISFRVKLNDEQLTVWNQEGELPEHPRGTRAHVTVDTAAGVPAVVAGFDTLKLDKYERIPGIPIATIDDGNIFQYEDNFHYVSFGDVEEFPAHFEANYWIPPDYGSRQTTAETTQPTSQTTRSGGRRIGSPTILATLLPVWLTGIAWSHK